MNRRGRSSGPEAASAPEAQSRPEAASGSGTASSSEAASGLATPSAPRLRERLGAAPVVWIILGATLVLVGHAAKMRAMLAGNGMDDAYISFRYADHLARGWGLVFNQWERVEGFSNLLWILILTP